MILYVEVKTNIPDAIIEYIEIKTPDQKLTLDWDESYISRNKDGFKARYKGVYFNEKYANGRIQELKNGKVSKVQIYSEKINSKPVFQFKNNLAFYDDKEELLIVDYQNCEIY